METEERGKLKECHVQAYDIITICLELFWSPLLLITDMEIFCVIFFVFTFSCNNSHLVYTVY